jgi:hypothetical protein
LRKAIKDQPLFSCTVAGEIDAPGFKENERAELPLPVEEFPSEQAAKAYFDRLIHSPFDLKNEPPIKLAGARIGARFQVLVLIHHIAGDAETLGILMRNALLYVHGQDGVKGRLATQAAFCQRESEYLRSADFRQDQDYWEKTLAVPLPFLHASQKRKGAMVIAPIDTAFVSALEALAKEAGTTVLAGFAALLGAFLRQRYGRTELMIGIPVGLRETQEEFATAGFYVNTIALRLQEREGGTAPSHVREAARQFKEALAHNRYCGDRVAADVLATHSRLEGIEEEGLSVRSGEMLLKASKLSASFTLETGASPRLVLEYDALFITEGDALLEELKRFMVKACGEGRARSRGQVLSDAWREVLRTEATAESNFFSVGGDSIKAIQITGILHRNNIKTLSAADFLRSPVFADLCCLMEKDTSKGVASGAVCAAPTPGQAIPLLPIQAELIERHPSHWKSFHLLLPLAIGPELAQDKIETWLRGLPARFEALQLAFTAEGARLLGEPQTLELKNSFFDAGLSDAVLLRKTFKLIAASFDPAAGRPERPGGGGAGG